MNTLHLTLKKNWFDMIASGEKKQEYREIKIHWIKRLGVSKSADGHMIYLKRFDNVIARNGYQKNAPQVEWKHLGTRIGTPNPAWCDPEDVGKTVFILDIGEVTIK